MSTVSGNLYSDFDLPPSPGNMKVVGGSMRNSHWQLNGGGVDIRLHSVSGKVTAKSEQNIDTLLKGQ